MTTRLEELLEDYSHVKKIGDGTYGNVYRAKSIQSDQTVAIKRYKEIEKKSNGVHATVLRELGIIKSLPQHEHIITIIDIIHTEHIIAIVMPFYEMDLHTYTKKIPQLLDHAIIFSIGHHLFSALAHLHAHGIFHRDVKPGNILLNIDAGEVVLCDFGLSSIYSLKKHHSLEVQTLWYRAPEIIMGCDVYTEKVDIWSAGIIILELFYGSVFWKGRSIMDQVRRIYQTMGTPPDDAFPNIEIMCKWPKYIGKTWKEALSPFSGRFNKSAINFISRCLVYYPSMRLSAKSAMHMLQNT